jgi:hypothetical protein
VCIKYNNIVKEFKNTLALGGRRQLVWSDKIISWFQSMFVGIFFFVLSELQLPRQFFLAGEILRGKAQVGNQNKIVKANNDQVTGVQSNTSQRPHIH